jgi:hypothetical protein
VRRVARVPFVARSGLRAARRLDSRLPLALGVHDGLSTGPRGLTQSPRRRACLSFLRAARCHPTVIRRQYCHLTVIRSQVPLSPLGRRMTADPHSTQPFRCPHCDALFQALSRGGTVGSKQPAASSAIIAKLIEFGYLKPGARYRAGAIEKAIGKLRNDLIRGGILLRR